MARQALMQYNHSDIYTALNKPLIKDPSFKHFTDAMVYHDPRVDPVTQKPIYPYAPGMRKINKDLEKEFNMYYMVQAQHMLVPRVHSADTGFDGLPVNILKPILGDITVNGIPMVGVILDDSDNWYGYILRYAVIYLDPQKHVRCYIPEQGNALNPLTGEVDPNIHAGYFHLKDFDGFDTFKDRNRFDYDTQSLLYRPNDIIKDIEKRIIRKNAPSK